MYQSDHDKVAEACRIADMEVLIDIYVDQAINNSEEFGFLNVRGHEVPDPTVVEPPLGYIQQPDIMEQMRTMLRNELGRLQELQDAETLEEANNFDIDDDYHPISPYEQFFDPPPGEPAGPTPPPPPAPPGEPPAPPLGGAAPSPGEPSGS